MADGSIVCDIANTQFKHGAPVVWPSIVDLTGPHLVVSEDYYAELAHSCSL